MLLPVFLSTSIRSGFYFHDDAHSTGSSGEKRIRGVICPFPGCGENFLDATDIAIHILQKHSGEGLDLTTVGVKLIQVQPLPIVVPFSVKIYQFRMVKEHGDVPKALVDLVGGDDKPGVSSVWRATGQAFKRLRFGPVVEPADPQERPVASDAQKKAAQAVGDFMIGVACHPDSQSPFFINGASGYVPRSLVGLDALSATSKQPSVRAKLRSITADAEEGSLHCNLMAALQT